MSCEQHRALGQLVKSEDDPFTRSILQALKRWWKPPHGFEVPDNNKLYVPGGFYGRDELFPILTGGYKPSISSEDRQRLVQTSRTVFKAMLLLDDGDPTFESFWKDMVDSVI